MLCWAVYTHTHTHARMPQKWSHAILQTSFIIYENIDRFVYGEGWVGNAVDVDVGFSSMVSAS